MLQPIHFAVSCFVSHENRARAPALTRSLLEGEQEHEYEQEHETVQTRCKLAPPVEGNVHFHPWWCRRREAWRTI